MPSFQVKHIRELYPMFWAKSCELSDLIAAQFQHVQDAEELEIDFGHWSTRATLDIIGFVNDLCVSNTSNHYSGLLALGGTFMH